MSKCDFNKVANLLMSKIFPLRQETQYRLGNITSFYISLVKSVNWSLESIRYLVLKIWETIASHIKVSATLDLFKSTIKQWKPDSCTCRLRKIYM